ncbi:hypothetical protein DL98DRAFT_522496 [Cadophora sp. DSE1049]|nr:hypothetical protein DL98DRAFT_522496 [Cadophora sp. DSE1049]
MHSTPLLALILPLLALLTAPATAIGNCKCQDSSGQYNDLTERCCMYELTGVYHGDQHHQCSSWSGSLSENRFHVCCGTFGRVGAYCWN